jgi:molybdopterin converting factor small subunit
MEATGQSLGAAQTVTVLFFANAREAAGRSRAVLALSGGTTVAQLVDQLRSRYGTGLVAVLPTCAVWVNGLPAPEDAVLSDGDEVAVLPPISGGSSCSSLGVDGRVQPPGGF